MDMEFVNDYRNARYNFFKWRYEAELVHKVSLALGFAVITGLAAQMRFYLPFTPVPITGQVFAVMLSAIALGRFWGGMSQVLYVAIGAMWIPWFAPSEGAGMFSSGIAEVMAKGTIGYIAGFVLVAFLIGWVVDSYVKVRQVRYLIPLFLAGTAIIYACGAGWLAYNFGWSLEKAIALGVLPYISVDILKAVAASFMATSILPKRSYGQETD
jgi:biotin transport system substrate-specific component